MNKKKIHLAINTLLSMNFSSVMKNTLTLQQVHQSNTNDKCVQSAAAPTPIETQCKEEEEKKKSTRTREGSLRFKRASLCNYVKNGTYIER